MQNPDQTFFDLHLTGVGYLNRARDVRVRRGEPFLAVAITALHGAADDLQKTRFDCRVTGAEAQRVLRGLMPDIAAGKAVLAGFRLGDLYAETFVHEKGERQGETGISLKARLLRITWAKVDGQTVYKMPRTEAA